jgi:FkbM family methyltransferase
LNASPDSTDIPRSSKWRIAGQHASRVLAGFPRFFFAHPVDAFKLLGARGRYFFTRRFTGPLAMSDGFVIETREELISYWSFFVEQECLTPEWVSLLLSENNPLIVDVGANAGLFSHRVWTLKPGAEFILFEPLPRMARKIEQWAKKTGVTHALHNKAVSDQCGTMTFYAAADNDTSASLIPEADKPLKYDVEVVTLDSVIPDRPILVMKIDVEGVECRVLAGARRTLERARFIILEAQTKAALDRIKGALGDQWLDKKIGANDYLFVKRNQ